MSSNKMALDARGEIRKDMPSSAYKMGDEFKPFHPSASHVSPEWRDGWNACFIAAIAALQAEPQFVPWVNVRGCGWHHYTPQNIDAMIRDLKAVEQGNEIPEWVNRDHRTRCGILWRVITALSHDVPLNPDPVMADDGLPPEPPPAPHLCIKPVCGPKCSDCNSAISDATMRRYAIRYAYLRDHDPRFGMPTAWLAFQTLDEAIDAALLATPPKG